jgi:hypothetical protein
MRGLRSIRGEKHGRLVQTRTKSNRGNMPKEMRAKPGDIVKIKTPRTPRASRAIVVRTYKTPDEDIVFALPDSSPLYTSVQRAIAEDKLDTMDAHTIYLECKTFHGSEWKLPAKIPGEKCDSNI